MDTHTQTFLFFVHMGCKVQIGNLSSKKIYWVWAQVPYTVRIQEQTGSLPAIYITV
jgi:hypothetical protein